MEGQEYRHILYYSPSHIEQLFFDRIDEHTEIRREKETQKSRSLTGSLMVFLRGSIGGEKRTRKNVIKAVNHEKEHIQTKKVVNHLLLDEKIPRIKNLDINSISPLYRFSCECQFLPWESDEFEDTDMIEVVGREGDIKFRGITSWENWGSRSDALWAISNEIPFPLDGIIQIKDINDQMLREDYDGRYVLEQADCDVNFIFICQSSREEVQKWWNRKDLMNDYYEKYH